MGAVIDELAMRGFRLLPAALKWRWHDRALDHIRARGMQLAPRVVRCRAGFRLLVDPADWIGSHLALRREFEPGLSRLVQRMVKAGDHFVDAGANIGYFSLLAASRVGSTGHVTAFEASPVARHALIRNIHLNDLGARVTVNGSAVWHTDAELTFHQGPVDNAGLSGLLETDRSVDSFVVAATRIDASVKMHEREVSFVKLDVEGAEYNALLGMAGILDAGRPIIALELSPKLLAQFGYAPADVLQFLVVDRDYVVHDYDAYGRLHKADIDLLARDHGQQSNLLFLPREKVR